MNDVNKNHPVCPGCDCVSACSKVADKACMQKQSVNAPQWKMLTEDEMWNAIKNCSVFDINETGEAIQTAFIKKQGVEV